MTATAQSVEIRSLLRLDEGFVHSDVYTSPAIFEREIEQIFHVEFILGSLTEGGNGEFSTIKEPDCSGSVMIRLIRLHRGAQKGSEANYFDAVRAPLLA